jgi:hypothetical protein
MTDNNKNLDIKVGEIWQVCNLAGEVFGETYDKRIIYVDSKRIIAESAVGSGSEYSYNMTYIYNLQGYLNSGAARLYRRKPKIEVIKTTVYVPVFRLEGGRPWVASPRSSKELSVESHKDFIKWIELSGSTEVEY